MSKAQRNRDRRKLERVAKFLAVNAVPMQRSDIACPDCGAGWDEKTNLRHDPDCPFAAALDRITDSDRDWFADNPGVDIRHRPATMAEILTNEWALGRGLPPPPPGHRWEAAGTVEVLQVVEGFRLRMLDAWVVPVKVVRP